ncbi:tellurite resistance/C4-dicarboxylate transporter family protein [Streptomyces kunmingensis]|uniref:Tellurite resistance/C4-dicarboxylate transporter family protein n=1 Tax=Streptomyces kunmingensis TaxID=68225 RepID=A0ABU6CM07_9ACTN|nr:tellurite resistance/C4-dicarboxylate transporter family protein [Streptomyces kunmingensis]MEB3965769.1 tellurite resistance/C4-dicarboxylate transporter family protein [Streptomyces kunmingensis]
MQHSRPNVTPRPFGSRFPPAAGAAVMATGIVSVGFRLTGHDVLSGILLVLAVALWVLLAADFTLRLMHDRSRWRHEAISPPALTAVAATCVLGTRFSLLGRQWLASALLVIAALAWPGLLVAVVRHWKRRMPGAVFLACVATQGLAVLGATLSAAVGVRWLGYAAVVVFWFGLVMYVAAFARFDRRQVLTGAGDHWVAGGALAISALAAAKLVLAGRAGDLWNSDVTGVLRDMCGVLLTLDVAWYVVLAVAEVLEPRFTYDVRRWSTVFPMGMTAVATLTVATAVETPWLKAPGQVLLWIAATVWLVVATGAVRSLGPPSLRSRAPR